MTTRYTVFRVVPRRLYPRKLPEILCPILSVTTTSPREAVACAMARARPPIGSGERLMTTTTLGFFQ